MSRSPGGGAEAALPFRASPRPVGPLRQVEPPLVQRGGAGPAGHTAGVRRETTQITSPQDTASPGRSHTSMMGNKITQDRICSQCIPASSNGQTPSESEETLYCYIHVHTFDVFDACKCCVKSVLNQLSQRIYIVPRRLISTQELN